MVRPIVDRQMVFRPIELENPLFNAVAMAPDHSPQIPIVLLVFRKGPVPQADVRQRPVAVGHPDCLDGASVVHHAHGRPARIFDAKPVYGDPAPCRAKQFLCDHTFILLIKLSWLLLRAPA